MSEVNPFDANLHIETIDEAIAELIQFHSRTAAPALLPHQFIGTVIDNTLALLTVPANSLDGGNRIAYFSEINNWRSLIRSIHSSFLSQIHLATERALIVICDEQNLKVQVAFQSSLIEAIAQIEAHIGNQDSLKDALKVLKAIAQKGRPQFDDYLNTVLSDSNLEKKTKKVWRKFFRALSIARNKTSHSITTLTDGERLELRDGGCAALISESGDLVINPRMYAQIVNHILNFLDLVSPVKDKS